MHTTELINHNFNPFQLLEKVSQIHSKVGAQSIFIGYMRDFREDSSIEKMFLAHYSPMTEQQIANIQSNLADKYNLLGSYVAHRIGWVLPTEPLVLISTVASHRKNAIVACQDLLEALKHNVPLWKKETHVDKTNSWVKTNTANKLN